MRYIVYETCPWHSRAVLLDSNYKLMNVRVDAEHRKLIEGTIVLGQVRTVQSGLKSAFVGIGDVVDGILPLSTIPDDIQLHEGKALPVRITRGSWEEKGARLSGRVALDAPENEKPPFIMKPAPDALSRAIFDAGDEPIKVIVTRQDVYADLLNRIGEDHLVYVTSKDDLWDVVEAQDEQLDNLTEDVYHLPGGGELRVEHTQALTAIDVDLGKGKNAFEVNTEAAYEIVRLCRLLDLGGSVLIDFITMKSKNQRKQVTDIMEQYFAERDSHKVTVLPMSPFGLVEINRERRGPKLDVLLSTTRYLAGRACLELCRVEKPGNPIQVEADVATADTLMQWLGTGKLQMLVAREIALTEQTEWKNRFVAQL